MHEIWACGCGDNDKLDTKYLDSYLISTVKGNRICKQEKLLIISTIPDLTPCLLTFTTFLGNSADIKLTICFLLIFFPENRL